MRFAPRHLAGLALCAAVLAALPAHAAPPLPPGAVTGKEFSTFPPDVDSAGFISPTQTLQWLGAGGLVDGVNYVAGGHTAAFGSQVDAMANRGDAYFFSVSTNAVPMLVNIGNEKPIRFIENSPLPVPGATGLWGTPPSPGGAGGPMLGTDALEVWGPEGAPDADRYSLRGDVLSDVTGARVAVWNYGGAAFVYTHQIATAIGLPSHLMGQLDLDALMVSERYDDGPIGGVIRPGDGVAGSLLDRRMTSIMPGEHILFSVAPIVDPVSGMTVLDGGEIWRWDGTAAPAVFLVHGGHVWDTANPVGAIFGVAGEDITVLEAVAAVPEPGEWAMLLAGLGVIGAVARRRRQRG